MTTDGTDGADRDEEPVIEAEVVESAAPGPSASDSPSGAGRRAAGVRRGWLRRPFVALLVVGLLVWWGWPRIEAVAPGLLPDRLVALLPEGPAGGRGRPVATPPAGKTSSDGVATRTPADRPTVPDGAGTRRPPATDGVDGSGMAARLRMLEEALADLSARQAALESAVVGLRAAREDAARRMFDRQLAVRLARLAVRIADGGPLADDLVALRALVGAMDGAARAALEDLIAALSPFAATGVARREELADRLARLLAEPRFAVAGRGAAGGRGPEDATEAPGGALGGFWRWLRDRVRIERRTGPGAGTGSGMPSVAAAGDPTVAAIRLAIAALRRGEDARAREALLTLGADAPAAALLVRDALTARLRAQAALRRALDRLADGEGRATGHDARGNDGNGTRP